MKTFAWIAAIAVAIDAVLSLALEVYLLIALDSGTFDFESYRQMASSTVAISIIAMGLLAGFFIHFMSRLKAGRAGTGALRFFLIAGIVLLVLDVLFSVVTMLNSAGLFDALRDMLPVLFASMNLVRGVLIVVLGVICLLLATSSSGATQVIGLLAFIAALAAGLVVFVSNGADLLDAFGAPLPDAIVQLLEAVFSIARWSIQLFWLLLAALLASIAAGIRNA